MTFSRIGGWAALGFAVLLAGTNLILAPTHLPLIGDPVDEVADYFGSHAGIIGFSGTLAVIAWLLAVLFGAAVVAAVWPSERARGEAWSLVGIAGLVLQNATFTVFTATRLALTGTASDAPATNALWTLNEALFAFNGTFLATAMLGLSVAGLRSGLIRSGHAVLGFTAGTLQLSSALLLPLVFDDPGAADLLGLAGWLLWVVWIAWYGIVLLRTRTSSAEPSRATEPAVS
ncbi:hypothetical protein [Jiangella alba]|uniref:DUF4386 family protein n=1 Tax=Jiangella alba TaxID=561176 RepID=A0A1H5Q0D2_9ACTN|nr:hypothetical protein [Jiangella alba]SEF18898.1 hypothetical protein SAMN04488561_6969 [Jiangella alba]